MINFKDISSAVGKYAPLLGSVISTANPVAGMIVSLIASLFGANKDDPNDLIEKINSDENADKKLKQLEIEHQDLLSNNKLADVENAREREIETTKITGKRDYVMQIIALLIIILTFVFVGIIFYFPGQVTTNNIVNIFIGNLMAYFTLIIKYYF
jgi:hypothetical protein